MLMQVWKDVSLGSEMWMHVQRDTDAGFRDVDTGSVRC
jgi:hypothetical protein